jgi:ATP-dependent Clp protease ATP-binding subunit ClpC
MIDPEVSPTLEKLAQNLTVLAERGELDPLVGRSREVAQLVDILLKRRANDPCLIGEPGSSSACRQRADRRPG